jgi:hypothetical protein
MKHLLLLLLIILSFSAYAQILKMEKLSFDSLNHTRIKTNKVGMLHLGGWAALNTISGVTGYVVANEEEWRAFHGMNAIWGTTNLLIAFAGYSGTRKELSTQLTCDNMLQRYESNNRLYLLNAGLDIVYIGTGTLLNAYDDRFNDPATWRGFGKSIMLQGAFLFLFDGTMYYMHQRQNKKWYRLMQGVCFTGNGFSLKL